MDKEDVYDLCFLECYLHTNNEDCKNYFLKYLSSIKVKMEYEKLKKTLPKKKCNLSICEEENCCFHNYIMGVLKI